MTAEVVELHTEPDALVVQLRNARKSRGITGRELAKALGVTQACISYWETGARQLSLSDSRRWAAALGYQVELIASQATTVSVKPLVVVVELVGDTIVCRREGGGGLDEY